MRGETTEWEAIVKAWNSYVHDRLGVFTLPNVPPMVSDYFRAGFAAGVAHARTMADPARVARLESLLREVGEVSGQFVDEDGYQEGIDDPDVILDWRVRIFALLGPAE